MTTLILSPSCFSFQSAGRTVWVFAAFHLAPSSSANTLLILCCLYLLFMVVPIMSSSQACTHLNWFSAFKRASAFRKSPPCPAWKYSLYTHPTNLCTVDSPLISIIYPCRIHVHSRSESIRCVKWMTVRKKPPRRSQIKTRHTVWLPCASCLSEIVHIVW